MGQTYNRFLFIFLYLCICWSIQTIEGKGGRGGGGSRSGGSRSGSRGWGSSSRGSSGSRSYFSSSSKAFSTSRRGYYTARYSYTWKTRAYSHHYVYVGHYHSWDYSRRDNVNDWSVCFNLVFSGVNNTPVIGITSGQRLRDLGDSDYEVAMEHVLNVSLHLMPSSNETDPMDELMPTDEKDFTKPWQYIGLFVCPMFPLESNAKFCCGEDEFQYCCSRWESWQEWFPAEGIFYGLVLTAFISCFAYAIARRRQRRLERLREMEMAATAAAAAANVVPAPGVFVYPTGQENTQPLLNPYDANNPPIGFMPMQNEEMKNQENNYGMAPTWPPSSEASVPPPYPTMPPPVYDFSNQPKA